MVDVQQLSRKRLVFIGLSILVVITYLLSAYTPSSSSILQCTTSTASNDFLPPTFKDLNQLATTAATSYNDLILVTVLVRSHQLPNLPNLLSLLGSLSYPSHQLSLAFLLTDPSTGSQPVFEHMVHHTEHQFHSISAYAKTMVMELPAQKNQVFELQPLKRSQWARARNFLTRSALRDEHKWVLSMDVNLEDAPSDIIQQLMAVDVDVVVPNCMVKRADGLIWGYDKANWQETELSITFTDNALDDYVYLEGKLGGSECSFLNECLRLNFLHCRVLGNADTPKTAGGYANRCRSTCQSSAGRYWLLLLTKQSPCSSHRRHIPSFSIPPSTRHGRLCTNGQSFWVWCLWPSWRADSSCP